MDEGEKSKKEALREFAEKRVRDEHGHFVPLVNDNIKVTHKTKDDALVDLHIGNPLRKITKLLEDIKKQKAFAFNIKGSLGAAGVIVVLGTFGVFGGTKAFCNKGKQSYIGRIMALNISPETDDTFLARLGTAWDTLVGKTPPVAATSSPPTPKQYLVLAATDNSVWRIKDVSYPGGKTPTVPVVVTGDIDSCAKTITVKERNAIQPVPFE